MWYECHLLALLPRDRVLIIILYLRAIPAEYSSLRTPPWNPLMSNNVFRVYCFTVTVRRMHEMCDIMQAKTNDSRNNNVNRGRWWRLQGCCWCRAAACGRHVSRMRINIKRQLGNVESNWIELKTGEIMSRKIKQHRQKRDGVAVHSKIMRTYVNNTIRCMGVIVWENVLGRSSCFD